VLANRLGAWAVKAELEDLAFKTLHPEEYAVVAAAVDSRAGAARATLSSRCAELKQALEASGLEVVDMSGRAKNYYGVWKKVRATGASVEQVYDLLALRVVVPAKHDCYSALRVVESLWAPLPGRFKVRKEPNRLLWMIACEAGIGSRVHCLAFWGACCRAVRNVRDVYDAQESKSLLMRCRTTFGARSLMGTRACTPPSAFPATWRVLHPSRCRSARPRCTTLPSMALQLTGSTRSGLGGRTCGWTGWCSGRSGLQVRSWASWTKR